MASTNIPGHHKANLICRSCGDGWSRIGSVAFPVEEEEEEVEHFLSTGCKGRVIGCLVWMVREQTQGA